MAFEVSTGAAYAVLYSVLIFFTLLALGAGGWLSCLPDIVTRCCTLKHHDMNSDGEGSDNNGDSLGKAFTTDYFLSARNSAGTWAIAISFFASGMGAWVLYGTTEMGATPELSWIAVLGYSGASAFPALLICWLGPKVRSMSDDQAFSTTDFGRHRYGRVMQVSIACVSGFYMFIFIVAELTAISGIFSTISDDFDKKYGISVTLSLGIFTVLYTSIAGLPASIVTDKFQGLIMAVLVIVLTIALTTNTENHISKSEFDRASNWTVDGLVAAVTLVIAIACAELFNQGTWQRVWAAESVPAMRKGFAIGSVMVFFLMMFFGVMGMIAFANDPDAYESDPPTKLSFLSFFYLLEPTGKGWQILALILVTALAASSVDSLQNGLSSIFSHDLLKVGWHPSVFTRILLVALNIPAIYLASEGFDVIALFLVADLVCATSIFPVFLGLQTEDMGILKAPTELGAFLGCVSGVVTVLINGIVNDADGGVFEYFWLRNNAMCALCGTKTMVSFIITPVISGVMTYVFSFLDIAIRGDRARQPLFPVAFDEDDDSNATESGKKEVDSEINDLQSTEEDLKLTEEDDLDVAVA